MKIKPTDGVTPGGTAHQVNPKPIGRYQKAEKTAESAFKNAIRKSQTFKAAEKTPNRKEATKATKAAFNFFSTVNKGTKA